MEAPAFVIGFGRGTFVGGSRATLAAIEPYRIAVCGSCLKGATMNYDFNGTGYGSLAPRRYRGSGVEKDSRSFKVTFVLPSQVG